MERPYRYHRANNYLVEVDVHALELEVGGAIVANPSSVTRRFDVQASPDIVCTHTPEPSRPCSPEMVCL